MKINNECLQMNNISVTPLNYNMINYGANNKFQPIHYLPVILSWLVDFKN